MDDIAKLEGRIRRLEVQLFETRELLFDIAQQSGIKTLRMSWTNDVHGEGHVDALSEQNREELERRRNG